MLRRNNQSPGSLCKCCNVAWGGCCIHNREGRALQVRCEVAGTMQKLAASSFVFVALHLWMQGVPMLHIALDMAASIAVVLWLCPTAAAFAEVLPPWAELTSWDCH